MYGSSKTGYMPGFKPAKKRGRPSDLSRFLQKQSDAFPVELAVERGRVSLQTQALMQHIHCEGCE
jgi:hypothetical protein